MNTPVRTAVLSGSTPSFPAVRNNASGIAINAAASATFKGAVSPKNRAISRPEAKPAPITVPMYKKHTFAARHI